MKLTRPEYSLIRIALILSTKFPHIPEPSFKASQIQAEPLASFTYENNEPNVQIKSHYDGYLVMARRKAPFMFRPVEWLADHAQAKLFMEQLEADHKFRSEAIRDAKGADFYLEKATRKRASGIKRYTEKEINDPTYIDAPLTFHVSSEP